MNKNRKIWIVAVSLVLMIAVLSAGWFKLWRGAVTESSRRRRALEFQKGVCYATWNRDRYLDPASDKSLEKLSEMGAGWVALVTTWYQEKVYSTDIHPTFQTPSDESIIHAVEQIHRLGMKVMLKPHLDLRHAAGGAWRGEICFGDEAEWNRWFASYKRFILHYAQIAQEHGVDMLCIGTELSGCTTLKKEIWKREIIDPIREVYKGPLTYAANWQDEYRYVKFWQELDYVGIDAYFPLSDEQNPDFEKIKEGWRKWVEDIEKFQKEISMPMIFPEVGYCSADGTAVTPWEEIARGKPNLEIQVNCYKALFQTFWEKPYFYGVYWWKWGTDVRFGGPANKGYSPQNKPAKELMEQWYKKPAPRRDPSIFTWGAEE